jgi:uncharacterized protein (DUF433 family)
MAGKPCIKGTRVTVGALVGLVAAGKSTQEILIAYPYVTDEDISQALSYAAGVQSYVYPNRVQGYP